MAVTVGDLVASGPALAQLTGAADVAITWVHSSDLRDPTPFLATGHLLLITGSQLPRRRPADVRRYVDRLVGVGASALGFGVGVARDEVPGELVVACRDAGLPLLEVPYDTPFIAVARWVAEALAAEAGARDAWALRAQRAISLAALSRGRTTAVLDELARQLAGAVVLYDAHGASVSVHGSAGRADDEVGTEAARLLRRRLRSASSVERDGQRTVLQTLGRRNELRGVLAVTVAGRLDPAGNGVVTSAAALVEFALEDVAHRRSGERALRGQLLRLLLAGRHELVAEVYDRLPTPPLRVLAASSLPDDVDVLAGPLDGLMIAVVADADLDQVLTAVGRAGVSRRSDYANLGAAQVQARSAYERAGATEVVVADRDNDLVLGLLPRAELAELARARLAPLLVDPEGADLLRTVEVWLRHNGLWEPAARELDVHRHTVKAKVRRVESLLGTPLDSFTAKAQLWMLLTAR